MFVDWLLCWFLKSWTQCLCSVVFGNIWQREWSWRKAWHCWNRNVPLEKTANQVRPTPKLCTEKTHGVATQGIWGIWYSYEYWVVDEMNCSMLMMTLSLLENGKACIFPGSCSWHGEYSLWHLEHVKYSFLCLLHPIYVRLSSSSLLVGSTNKQIFNTYSLGNMIHTVCISRERERVRVIFYVARRISPSLMYIENSWT